MLEITDTIRPPSVAHQGKAAKFPFRELKVGQSFFIPDKRKINISYWRMVTGRRFMQRCETDENGNEGLRIWRI